MNLVEDGQLKVRRSEEQMIEHHVRRKSVGKTQFEGLRILYVLSLREVGDREKFRDDSIMRLRSHVTVRKHVGHADGVGKFFESDLL